MIHGSFTRSENYDIDFNKLSTTFGVQQELWHIREMTNMDILLEAQ
jgi:hypothetical protein